MSQRNVGGAITRKSTVNPKEWIVQMKDVYGGVRPVCPACRKRADAKLYSMDDGVGYAEFICESCGEFFHACRIRYPSKITAELIRF